jgi:hypothetical protein
MTTFTKDELPSGVNTLEKLSLWVALAMRAANGSKAVVEAEGLFPERVAQVPMVETPNDGLRFICRISLKMDPTFVADKSKKLWEFAEETTLGAIGATFTSN